MTLFTLRLADQGSRTQYADLLWSRANSLLASADEDEQAAGMQNLVHLYGLFPEHAQHSSADTLLSTASRLADGEALLSKENAERSTREAIYQAIWDSSTSGNSVTIDLSLGGDPDGDGQSALLELALNLNPFTNDADQKPTAGKVQADGSTWLTLTHRREKIRDGFTIQVVASPSLAPTNWQPLTSGPDFVTSILDEDIDGTGFTELIEQRARISTGTTSLFLRLKITRQR